jgi:hypothetical protein
MEDKLVKCDHCGSEMCYSVQINEEAWAYSCTGCGFTANDIIKEGHYDIEKFEEAMPELYKDLKYFDGKGRAWYPLVIQNEVGVVFIDGTDLDNWGWAGIKNRPLTEAEKEIYVKEKKEVPPFKSDGESLKHFGKDGFLPAVNYINGI